MSWDYKVVKVGPNQDVGRVISQFVSKQQDMRLVTSIQRGSGAELIFESNDVVGSEGAITETTADGIQSAFRERVARQQRYESKAAEARWADDARRQQGEARLTAMSSEQIEQLREQAKALLPYRCQSKESMVRAKMRDLLSKDAAPS